jgi:hypothetical protein
MSEVTVLGKRERNRQTKGSEDSKDQLERGGPIALREEEEDSDDDVGPMPAPDNGSAPRKRRKGWRPNFSLIRIR